jgi:hypothetical protein
MGERAGGPACAAAAAGIETAVWVMPSYSQRRCGSGVVFAVENIVIQAQRNDERGGEGQRIVGNEMHKTAHALVADHAVNSYCKRNLKVQDECSEGADAC